MFKYIIGEQTLTLLLRLIFNQSYCAVKNIKNITKQTLTLSITLYVITMIWKQNCIKKKRKYRKENKIYFYIFFLLPI